MTPTHPPRRRAARAIEEAHTTAPSRSPDTGDDAGVRPSPGSTYSTPRWVYVFGIVAVILLLLLIIVHLTGVLPMGHTR